MIKNLHLLLILLGLAVLNVLLGIWVVSGEKANARAIDDLSGQLAEARREYQSLAATAGSDREKLAGQLRQTEAALQGTRSELGRTRTLLDSLLSKKWLVSTSSAGTPPWDRDVEQVRKEILALRTDLKKLSEMPPAPGKPSP